MGRCKLCEQMAAGPSPMNLCEDHAADRIRELEAQNKRLKQVVTFLWDLIDDIDTATDIAKSDDVWYRKRVETLVGHRWATGITTDGYELDLSKLADTKYQDTFPDKQEAIAMNEKMPTIMHGLRRTSPKGGPFIGVCTRCGKENVTIQMQQSEECPNTFNQSDEQTILTALEGNSDE